MKKSITTLIICCLCFSVHAQSKRMATNPMLFTVLKGTDTVVIKGYTRTPQDGDGYVEYRNFDEKGKPIKDKIIHSEIDYNRQADYHIKVDSSDNKTTHKMKM